MEVIHTSKNVLSIVMDDVKLGWEKWFLLSSDRHWDGPKCDRKLMFKHLEKAKQRKASILDFGDFFSMMEGRYDPRRSYDDLRPEYKEKDYLGAIVRDAAKQLRPYAPLFLMIGRGNNDQSVLKNNRVDVMNNFVYYLNKDDNVNIQLGG